ncbi:ribosome maturation factor RimM [Enterococcus sp. AZ103]|uniref:ribosome maturation factor RimM n=1 Tax=Enterococcus sp. AZ103 TaxID=2774628 RepID=UPI003F1FE7B7
MINYYTVGKIVNTHGVQGEVRVISQTDFPDERYQVGETLYLFREDDKKPTKLTVTNHRKHKNFDLLSFEGIYNINLAEALRDGVLKISENQLTDLEENEFYYHEIIGLKVFDEQNQELGEITEILSPGANDVWVVKRKGKKDALIPYIESVVKKIDLENERVDVEIPEGLLDNAD